MAFAFTRRVAVSVLLAAGAVVSFSSVSCRALEPTNKPIDACRRSCESKAKRQCTEAECARGCELILDRLVEHEGENVIKCVATGTRRCTDVVWADCAARIGVHADGGPPGPLPPAEEE
jgi:hypothetical protein